MLDNRKQSKVKNKIEDLKLELTSFCYTVKYHLSKDNVAPELFTGAFLAYMLISNLNDIHEALCHPGASHMLYFVMTKSVPFSTEDVKKIYSMH